MAAKTAAAAPTTQVAVREAEPANPVLKLVDTMDKRRADVRALVSTDQEADRFIRIVKNAIMRDPKIAEATPQSVFLECQKAAADGLVLDGREAALVRFSSKVKGRNGEPDQWVTNVAYIPMIAGVKKRVRNSGEIKDWNFGLVYEAEVKASVVLPDGNEVPRFRYWRDDAGQHLLHHPMIPGIDGERGKIVLVYSAVRLNDGSPSYEVMDMLEVRGIMARSKSKDREGNPTGPWATDFGEMAKKTVGKRHVKNLPVSSEIRDMMDRDNDLYTPPPTVEGEALPASVARRRAGSAADRLAAARQPEPAAEEDEEEQDEGEAPEPDIDPGQGGQAAALQPDDVF